MANYWFFTFTALFLLGLGILGLFWMTLGSPIILNSYAKLKRVYPRADARGGLVPPQMVQSSVPISLEVLIPAHNEERVIRQTLESVVDSIRLLQSNVMAKTAVSVTVGLDHCTDGTQALVEEFAARSEIPVRWVQNTGEGSKWASLMVLIQQSTADWVALVDSGSVWKAELLRDAWPFLNDPETFGLAPSYMPKHAGGLERLNWRLEQGLKCFENRWGGPISVHGATVLYRRPELNAALSQLVSQSWLNDDVVIPLSMRLNQPERRLVYLTHPNVNEGGWVSDVGVESELKTEYRRRRRMIMGNLQWIREVLLRRWRTSPLIVLTALRRVLRMFWAYWILSAVSGFTLGVLVLFPQLRVIVFSGAVFGGILLISSNWVQRAFMAFLSGLRVHSYWREFSQMKGVSWS